MSSVNILMTGTDEVKGNSEREITLDMGLVANNDRVFLQAVDPPNVQLYATNVKDGKFKVKCIQFSRELGLVKFNYLVCR